MKEFSLDDIEAIINCSDPEVIKALLIELITTVQKQAEQIEDLKREIKKIKDQQVKNSRNSSKPPSTDQGQNAQEGKIRKPKSKNKPGGQPGHPGSNLKLKDDPDESIDLPDHTCDECEDNEWTLERRQVIDVKITVTTIEYRAKIRECSNGCDRHNREEFPKHVQSPVQYSPKIKGIITYLNQYQLIPFKRLTEMLGDLFGLKGISQGTVANASKYCSLRIGPFIKELKDRIIVSKVVHCDETGVSVKAKKYWLHVTSTKLLSYFYIHNKRGQEAMDSMDILPNFRGRAIHDFWRSYLNYLCEHGLCNAHHLRELTFLHEQEHQPWALKMIKCLISINKSVKRAKNLDQERLNPQLIGRYESRFQQILDEGYAQNPWSPPKTKPKRGRPKRSKSLNMLERLDHYRSEALAFMYDFDVHFDNNQAERDIRMNKVRQKISGTFRGDSAPEDYCRIRSYISTLRKNNQNILDALLGAFLDKPWIPFQVET